MLCNALKCPVRYLLPDIALSVFVIVDVCGYATLVILQLFNVWSFVSVQVTYSCKNFLFSFSMTCTVCLEFLPPFCVPRWNPWLPIAFFFFFSTGWQFTLKIQPHFSRNWGTWYTRATKNNKRMIMIIIILIVINIIVIQFFKIGLQDYWPTMYVGSYVLVKVHHSEKFRPFSCPLLKLLRR